MKTDEETFPTRIAVQPETDLEQQLVGHLFERLGSLDDAPEHPEYVGTENVFYTLDLGLYDGLNHGLWEESDVGVTDAGRLDPEPGSRALVVVHEDETYSGQATEDEVERAVQSLAEGEDEDNEFTEDAIELARDIADIEPLDDVDDEEIEALAQRVATTGIIDIPLGAPPDDLVDHLEEYVEVVEDRVKEEIEEIQGEFDEE